MLKNIIFSIENQTARKEAGNVIGYLAEAGLKGVLSKERALCGDWTDMLLQKDMLLEETLFVTDNAREAESIQRAGGYVAVLFTEENKQDNFVDIQYALENIEGVEIDHYRRLYERCAGIPWVILQTERCIVREITINDIEDLYRIYEEPSITLYMENLFADREEEITYTQNYIQNVYGFYGYGMWVITHRDSGKVIGRAGVEYKADTGGLELGYMIARPYQKQGYAWEVCQAILEYARNELGFEKIFSFVREGNEASINLCRKLEMEPVESPCEVQGNYLVFQKKWKYSQKSI